MNVSRMKPATRKVLEELRLWDRNCLLCGDHRGVEAEHCLTQGRRIDAPEAIIPLCRDCHRGNLGAHRDKEAARIAGAYVYFLCHKDAAFDVQRHARRIGELTLAQVERVQEWASAVVAHRG